MWTYKKYLYDVFFYFSYYLFNLLGKAPIIKGDAYKTACVHWLCPTNLTSPQTGDATLGCGDRTGLPFRDILRIIPLDDLALPHET
jgi:hypothetical protein